MGFIADIFTANKAVKAQEKAADKSIAASQQATDKSLGLQKEIFDKLWGGTQVQRDAGDAATRMMASLMGLSLPAGQTASPAMTQTYPTGQQDATASYGGRAPQSDIERRVAAMSDTGLIYDGLTPNALARPATTTAQYGQAQPVADTPAAPANALDPTAWLRSTPGYQFNFDEGARALNTKLAGEGRLQSGDASREAVRYGQNYGDRIFGDQFNRLAAIAGAGQTAQSQSASAGTNFANNSGNALMQNAGNLSSSYQNKGNAISGFWGNVQGGINNVESSFARAMMGGF